MPWIKSQAHSDSRTKVGLINRAAVNKFLFALVSSSIVISVFMIIFAIWDYVGYEIAHKTVATCTTLIGGGILFSFVNDYFGSKTIETKQTEDSV